MGQPTQLILAHTNARYLLPGADPKFKKKGLTFYRAIVGPGSGFEPRDGRLSNKLMDIKDGSSNTIMFVEATDPVPWTKPDELVYDPNGSLPRFGGHFRGGFHVAMFDGSVRFLTYDISEQALRAALTADGGENIPLDE